MWLFLFRVFFTIYCWFVEQVICFSAGRKSQRLIYQIWNSWHYRVKDTFHTHNQTDDHWWILVEQTLQHHPPTHHTAVQCYQCTLIPQQTSSVTDTACCSRALKIFLKPLKIKVSPSFSLCVGSSWKVFGIKTRGTKFLFYFQRKKMEAEQHIL